MRPTFFEEHARYRRARWRWTLLAVASTVSLGVPLSIVITPLVYLLAMLGLQAASGALPIAPAIWALSDRVAAFLPTVMDAYRQGADAMLGIALPIAGGLVLPGAITALAIWVIVRGLLERVSLHATLDALGARAPQESVVEEREFAAIVAQAADAAGIERPGAWVTEHLSANLAFIGPGVQRAAVVASRRLLNTCDRDETHALVAHAVGSLVHGDQAIVARIESVQLTGAALNAIVNAPFGKGGRQVLWTLVRAALRRRSPEHETLALTTLLAEWARPSHDLTRFFERDATRPPSLWRSLLHLLLLPLYLLNIAVFVTAALIDAALVTPVVATVSRTRRYAADRTAVALTGNATQLARALRNIAGSLGDPAWAPARLRTVVASDVTDPWRSPGGLTNAHPPAEKRLKRLAAQGAVLAWEHRTPSQRSRASVLDALGSVLGVPIVATTAYVSAVVVALVAVLAMGAMALTLAAIHGVFRLLQ